MSFRRTFGEGDRHEVVVTYGRALRLLRVTIDGRTVYRHSRLLPWARRRATEVKTRGPETHNLIIEPPGSRTLNGQSLRAYRLWLDGTPVLNVQSG